MKFFKKCEVLLYLILVIYFICISLGTLIQGTSNYYSTHFLSKRHKDELFEKSFTEIQTYSSNIGQDKTNLKGEMKHPEVDQLRHKDVSQKLSTRYFTLSPSTKRRSPDSSKTEHETTPIKPVIKRLSTQQQNIQDNFSKLHNNNNNTSNNTNNKNKDNSIKNYHQRTLQYRQRFNCTRILNGSKSEIASVEEYHKTNRPETGYPFTEPEEFFQMFKDCDKFKAIRGYPETPGSQKEASFPLAVVILGHQGLDYIERLLRILYQPQNVFCIHMDSKVSDSMKTALSDLAACFPNVILASQPQNVTYAHMTRLMADYVCMRDIVRLKTPWKYLINMAATSFPLKSNSEIVDVLTLLKGKNDIHERFEARKPDRWLWKHHIYKGKTWRSNVPMPQPPHNLTILKGQAYNTYSRAFLEWVMTNPIALDLFQWSKKTYSPDEHYWATLNNLYHNPFLKAPGGFQGHPDKKGYITTSIVWTKYKEGVGPKCYGKSVHRVCNFGCGDLSTLLENYHFIANKFDLTFDPVAYSCMEEMIEHKIKVPNPKFSLNRYEELYFVWFDPNNNNKKAGG